MVRCDHQRDLQLASSDLKMKSDLQPVCQLHLRANDRWTYGLSSRPEERMALSIYIRCEAAVYDYDDGASSRKLIGKKVHLRLLSSDNIQAQIQKTNALPDLSAAIVYLILSANAISEQFESDGEICTIDPLEIWMSVSAQEVEIARQIMMARCATSTVNIIVGVYVEDAPSDIFVSVGELVRETKRAYPIFNYQINIISV